MAKLGAISLTPMANEAELFAMTTKNLAGVITPLVRRHAEDAAFYWAQHDANADSASFGLSGLTRLSHLLEAHLEGLDIAGDDAGAICHAALARWKRPAEAFVCAHVAISMANTSEIEALLVELRARPDELLRGVISALAWLPVAAARGIIEQWTKDVSDGVLQVAALRAIALIGPNAAPFIAHPLAIYLGHSNEHVRAAACRVAASINLGSSETVYSALVGLLDDPVLAVRAEAAIALGSHGQTIVVKHDSTAEAISVLWECVLSQASLASSSTGWYSKQALRRLNRWVQHLALQQVSGVDFMASLNALTPHAKLRFIAYHGDPIHLPAVVDQMSSPDFSRYAGWVWQTITGVDLMSAGLNLAESIPAEVPEAVTKIGMDANASLIRPDPDAIRRYQVVGLSGGMRYLAGDLLTPERAVDLLVAGPQAVRSICAYYLQWRDPQMRLSVRSSAPAQRAILDHLKVLLRQGTSK